jgi:hypothetical protein
MDKVRFIISLFLFGFLGNSCKKELPSVDCNNPTTEISQIRSIIVGRWTWAYEKYRDRFSQTYIIKTPQTEGETRLYVFTKDNDVREYKNNSLMSVEIYDVTTLDVVTGFDIDKEKTILLFKDKTTGQRTDFAPVQVCNDTLTLNYQYYLDTRGQEKWYKN